ncbi:hypothetical protein [Mycolicibacterium lacusdiani]|uniref:hypothetical protein n=1 Tax=Mycolicibacterium lacusdiani TaxID=2895283 RepID=UPI001F438978|nr:hypothetical protein [Mycolicibacterium lacusdiani]
MDVCDVIEALDEGCSLTDATRWLGVECLQNRATLRRDLYIDLSDTCTHLLEIATTESTVIWNAKGDYVEPPSEGLREALMRLSMTPELAALTVLRGICRGAARDYFASVSRIVSFERGSIVPLPERRLAKIEPSAHTAVPPEPGLPPNPLRTHAGLLGESGFIIWDTEDWILELDFTFRDRLDMVCAIPINREGESNEKSGQVFDLPKMATVHPVGSDDMAPPDESTAPTFFGVHPTVSQSCDAQAVHRRVFESLTRVPKDVPIAVLPEFCLLSPDGLDALVEVDGREIPAVVVAGSAHTGAADRQKRANTSHVFLDRYRIMSTSKHEPFVLSLKIPGGDKIDFREDISPQDPRVIRVAAGTATRLTIAICSDLNSIELVGAMTKAGVNILLSPSWSPKIGAAATGLTQLAGYCQCVGLVANTPGHLMAFGKPTFWACTAVPRDSNQAHVHFNGEWDLDQKKYHEAASPVVGILNPNLISTDPGYWTWLY